MRIGELLVMNGLITEEQLAEALKVQVQSRQKLGEILIERGNITERQLAEALEFQLGVPVVNLQEAAPDRATVQLIPESIVRKHCLVPIDHRGGKIKVAMLDPLNQEAIKAIQMATGMSVQLFLATRTELEQAINQNYGISESAEELNHILQSAVEQNASDIHLDPQESGLKVMFRIDHVLRTQKTIPKPMQEALVERIKIISNLSSAERRLPQNGRFQTQIAQKRYDVRVSTLPAVCGESIVLRVLDMSQDMLKLDDLNLNEPNKKLIEQTFKDISGLVLVSGPSVSGKSTMLYALLQHLKREEVKIITLEDTMIRRIEGITQVEVNERLGLTFAFGLQSVLRQDPNIVVIDDIRDADTVEASVRAALSGRTVIGAIYGAGAVHTIRQLIDMGIDPHRAATSLSGVLSQRLARRICRQCAQSVPMKDEELKLFEEHGLAGGEEQKSGGKGLIGNFRSFVSAKIDGKMTVTRGSGCRLCHHTGYRGYITLQEVLVVDEPLRALIRQNRPAEEIRDHMTKNGFKSMLHDGLWKAREGQTTVEEVLKVLA